MSEDIRWVQRFSHFCQAFAQLSKFIEKGTLNELEKQGMIQAFEYTYELAWNTLKDYFENQGEVDIYGSRDAFRLAFRRGLIEDGQLWMDMIKSRTLTTHTYNQNIAEEIAGDIASRYYGAFSALQKKLNAIKHKEVS